MTEHEKTLLKIIQTFLTVDKATFYAHDINVLCDDEGHPSNELADTIAGIFACPKNNADCNPSCPCKITYERQSGLPFNFTKRLGQGGFASVYQGLWDDEVHYKF